MDLVTATRTQSQAMGAAITVQWDVNRTGTGSGWTGMHTGVIASAASKAH